MSDGPGSLRRPTRQDHTEVRVDQIATTASGGKPLKPTEE